MSSYVTADVPRRALGAADGGTATSTDAMHHLAYAGRAHPELRMREEQARLSLAAAILAREEAADFAALVNVERDAVFRALEAHARQHGCHVGSSCPQREQSQRDLNAAQGRHTVAEQAAVDQAVSAYAQALNDLIRGEAA